MHYMLFYDYVPDYPERRGRFRDAHLRRIEAALARGELVLGGAFADPADGAMILFEADSPAVPRPSRGRIPTSSKGSSPAGGCGNGRPWSGATRRSRSRRPRGSEGAARSGPVPRRVARRNRGRH